MKRSAIGDLCWLTVLVMVSLFFILPATNRVYLSVAASMPYLVGFLKFAILATMGSMLAQRLAQRGWQKYPGLGYKALAWGFAGVAITFMFSFFYTGVQASIKSGILPSGSGAMTGVLQAFFPSLLMNITFGPVLMTAQRLWDVAIDLHAHGEKISLKVVVTSIDWEDFFGFVIGKTLPFWWIPIHTLTFMLPAHYRVLAAAYLSIVIGIILTFARNRKKSVVSAAATT